MSDSKEKETVVATARIKNITDDEKTPIDAVQLEVSGTINASNKNVEPSKRCIIFVIDKSGSMGGSRINTVREAVIPFIEEFCENENIMIKLILFESNAVSHDIPNDRTAAKLKLASIINAGGGTDFAQASTKLVEVSDEILTKYNKYELTVIICSDGEVSKSNAQQAHATWKKFVNCKYMKVHKQFPFVESIGISSNHDADILDGFILNDDNGNYTRANDSNAIRETFERAAENATMRETYKIRLSSNNSHILFIDSLYNQSNLPIKEYTLTQTDFLLKVWINKKSLMKNKDEDLYIIINDNIKIKITMCDIIDKGKVQEYIIDFYHQILKDMINALRNIQDEKLLKIEAEKIDILLQKYETIFVQITAQPGELSKLENELVGLLNNCNNDQIEERATTLKHYKKVRSSWKGHRLIVNQFNATLSSLKELLREILTGKTRMQEIRQHILDLHFSKKHAKRMNKLILTSEQLIMRQEMYDNIQRDLQLKEENIINLSNELGSGCFLSTMTLKDCALDGQSLWLCGRVNRSGGVQVSNPEIIRIEYISPNLVSYEYFNMAMDISSHNSNESEKGFLDGSRNIINARLFPIYGGNMEYLKICKPYIFEVLSHTLSGRNDIKINDYSTLSAILGYMIATHKQTTQNLIRIFKDILPSYIMLSKYINVYPYKNEKNKEIDFKANKKILLFELFNTRLERYCNNMQVRCSSLISNVQCLFGDALLTNNYKLLLHKPIIWFSMLSQRLRSLIKNRIPGDQSLFTQARQAEVNHAQALRVIIRGTDLENDVFDNNDTKQDDNNNDLALIYFENQYKIQKELKKERLAPFDIPECKSLKNDIDFSMYDPYKITPSQIQLCAQILSRIGFKDLIQAHRFFRILNEILINKQDIIKNIDKFKLNNVSNTLSDFCIELKYKLSMITLRALCGFVLLIQSNSLFQNIQNYQLCEELISKPSVIIQYLHEKVIAESKRKPRRMVARIKHKPSSQIDLSKRSQHNQILSRFWKDNKSLYWTQSKENISNMPQFNISVIGHHKAGKSSLIGRLLCDLGAVSDEYKPKQANTYGEIINNHKSNHETMSTVIKSKDLSSNIRINDTPNPVSFYKNVIKTFGVSDSIILCIPAPNKEFEESIKRINVKTYSMNDHGRNWTLSYCMKALINTDLIICCITKMDKINYKQKQYESVKNETIKMLKKRGYNEDKLIFIPICSLNNDNNNIYKENINEMKWYNGFEITIKKNKYIGKTMYDACDILSKLNLQKIEKKKKQTKGVKFFVSANFEIKGVGSIISAYIIEGCLNINDEITFVPSNINAKVKSLQKYYNNIKKAIPGDICCMTLDILTNNKLTNDIIVGDIGCDMKNKNINSMKEINTLVFVVGSGVVKRIRNGYVSKLYLGCDHVRCTVKQIKWKIGQSTKNVKVTDPTFVESGDQAEIVLTLQKAMAISKFEQFKAAGRFVAVSCDAPVFFGKIC